jgi:Xaa-Pro aminopeptidase
MVLLKELNLPLLDAIDGIEVMSFDELGDGDAPPRGISPCTALAWLTVKACRSQGVRSAVVTPRFPLVLAEALRQDGIGVAADEALFVERRRVKSTGQVTGMRRAIRAIEAAWDSVREALRDDGRVSSEELQMLVLSAIAVHDAVAYDIVIVPSGTDSTVAHGAGAGAIEPGTPVIADLIARDRATGMYADLTRTFSRGEPTAELVDYFNACRQALEASISAIEPGVLATDLNAVASEIFERAGHPTLRSKQSGVAMNRGFWHSLGHGIGFELHEPPSIAKGSNVPLREGEVLCIEPALYRRGFGGCRLEDMVLVTSSGHERLSRYELSLAP